MKKRILSAAILALSAWLLLSGAALAQRYVFQDLGDLGGYWSEALGINDAGQVVGWSHLADPYPPQGFLWDPQTKVMTALGALGSGFSTAYAINNLGQIAGSSYITNYLELHPVLWDANRTIQDLGNLSGAGICELLALNDQGRAAGYMIDNYTDYNQWAFTWDPTNGIKLLPNLSESASPYLTTGWGINNQGEVVGDSQDQDYYLIAFFCPPNATQLTNLGTLGGLTSTAYAINNSSQVVGGADRADFTRHAFLWDSVNHMQDLDPLSVNSDSEAYAVNEGGQVVGAFDVNGSPTAFLWTPTGGMQDLNSLVMNLPPGTHLDAAYGINKTGQIVGSYDFGNGAFLLTVAKPSIVPVQLLLMD